MADPKAHLPALFPETTIRNLLTSLSLPSPTTIEPLTRAAEFHSIYFLHYAASSLQSLAQAIAITTSTSNTDCNGNGSISSNPDGTTTLVLRVSGTHIPHRKTLNEVAVMRWVRANTAVPVPAVVRFDAGVDNVLGCEFTILGRVRGRSVDDFYDELGDTEKVWLVNQLTDILLELNRHEWTRVSGLTLDDNGDVVPGPVLEDTFWTVPDIKEHWGAADSIDTLNPSGPYDSHATYIAAYLTCFVHAISTHPSLAWLRDLLPRLIALQSLLPSLPSLQRTRLILAHKDLHFANVMALPSGELTAVLDWEFAGVVPSLRWDPVRAFLWNARRSDQVESGMRELFHEELERRGVERWWEGVGEDTEQVWVVVKVVRALVEVCPRGQRKEMVVGWRALTEEALTKLGV